MFWEGIKQCSRFSLQSLNETVEKLHRGQILTYNITYNMIYNITNINSVSPTITLRIAH